MNADLSMLFFNFLYSDIPLLSEFQGIKWYELSFILLLPCWCWVLCDFDVFTDPWGSSGYVSERGTIQNLQ